MAKILLTGANGFIGTALAEALHNQHDLVCIGRREPDVGIPFVRGIFHEFEDLRQLDRYDIDAVIHLAAVTGGCLERDGMRVNVEGTRCLMRYLIDRGCKRFVMASSTAAVGFQNVKFRPQQLPMREDHPCLDRDGYGVSKYLMEKVTEYYQLQNDDLEITNLRLAAIYDEDNPPPKVTAGPVFEWACGAITQLARCHAVDALCRALGKDYLPGVHTMNIVHPQAWVDDPVPQILRAWYPELDIDLSFYERPGNEKASVYDTSRAREMLGFHPE